MNQKPDKIVIIALDDYLEGLKYRISESMLGQIKDHLAKDIPNELKDEKKRVRYDKNNNSQHISLFDPQHEIQIVTIEKKIV